MKVIRTLLILCPVLLLIACEDNNEGIYNNDQGRFARFFLQLDSNGEPITAPAVELGIIATETYNKANVKPLKIPVALTSQVLEEPVTINYSATLQNIDNVILDPPQVLSFSGTKLVDTLVITTTQLWDSSIEPSIELTLTSSSNPDIKLGIPNQDISNRSLLIKYKSVDLKYNIGSPSRVDISSDANEQYEVIVNFPNGYLLEDIDNFDFFTSSQSNFDFVVERQPLTSSSEITFLFKLNESLTNDDLQYQTRLNLNQIPGYEITGNPSITFVRDPLTDRDKTINTASQFYDTSDAFYRLFGVHWFDFNADGSCEWVDFNTFTNPVIVDQNDPNAILGDDRGTSDPSDDIYYHAFRINFNSNLANRTTNPFNLRRWFTNEGTNADTSPGFNITPAIEFFPENGTSTTQGAVHVIPQTITIGTTASNGGMVEFFELSGSGTYVEIAPGIFEIDIEVSLFNSRVLGGLRTDRYKIYNTSNFVEPATINRNCSMPVSL